MVIVCPSYEGQPPDNAIHFVEWLHGLYGEELKGVKYAVFGCGHHDWHDTFHRVPKLIDELISKHGAERITDLGLCDVADADVMDQFDEWKDKSFWPAISKSADAAGTVSDQASSAPTLELEVSTDKRAQALRQEVGQAVVLDAKTLTHPEEPEKRHLGLQLPTDMTYKAGDYLAVLPLNPSITVRRVMKRFSLPWDAAIKVSPEGNTTSLPSNTWVAAHDVLKGYVELSQPPSKKDLRRFITQTSSSSDQAALDTLLNDTNHKDKESISTLDILERYSSISLPFSEFLTLLPPLRVRLYSISSSPLKDPTACTISYGVLDQPGSTGWTSARHPGVASTYLASLQTEDRLHVAVRPSHSGFYLPAAGSTNPTPVIMICAGTGIAPFRAFVQERALQLQARDGDREKAGLGKALLFVGCRSEEKDRLYNEELQGWEKEGAVSVRYAYSKETEKSLGCKYVQDRVRRDAKEMKELWDAGAKIYICGASVLVREVASVLKEVLFEGLSEKEILEQYSKAMRGERIVTDVFG
jgi:cytochrome P450 / NADPH-cytochrome P450 reductase